MRTACRIVLIVCLGLLSAHLYAQSAAITGEVQDSSGAAIRGAEVRIVDQVQGSSRTVFTNDAGAYDAPFLNPGQYRVYIQAHSFSTAVSDQVILTVGQTLVFTVRLKVGSTQQEVSVNAESQLLNATDATVGTIVDRTFVENIPLNGRSFQDLISMTPGVVTQSPQANSSLGFNGDFSVNGQRTESNYYMVDGVSANTAAGNGYGVAQSAAGGSLASSTAFGTTQSLVSVDALQEFRVESSTYSAEYGRSPGGQLLFVTRSGTNNLHGSAFDYLRNNYFDANDWFNDYYGKPLAALRQNDFGGTVGGPITLQHLYDGKNRSFFFFSYEGLRLDQPQAATIQYVPDNFMRKQAPVALQSILNAYPVQNGIDYGTSVAPSLAQFIQSYSLPGQIDSTSVRADQVMSQKLALFFRFSDTPSSTESRALSAVTKTNLDAQTYTFGATSQFSNRYGNELRAGYARSTASVVGSLDSFAGASPINLAQALGAGGYKTSSPVFYIYLSGIGSSELTSQTASNRGNQFNLTDTFSLQSGHHQFKVGVDYRRIASPLTPSALLDEPLFESASAILNNKTTLTVLSKSTPTTPIFQEFAAFAQDEWRVAQRVSVSLGLRWEISPPPTEENGDDAYTLLGNIANPSSLNLAPQGTPLWKTPFYNFAPRLGVAWTPHTTPGWETVIRTGGGIFFDTSNQIATLGYEGIGFEAIEEIPGLSAPVTASQLAFSPSAAPPYTSNTVYAFPSHLQLPYTLEWNVSLQQALGKTQAFTLSYVGSNGRRLLAEQQESLHALNPKFSAVTYFPNGITSNYQGMQLQFQRSVAHGLQALASYTWSHSIDFGSNDGNLPQMRGNSDFDVRSNFSSGINWELPSIRTNKIAGWVIDGWGIDARLASRTAFPVTLDGTLQTNPATGVSYYGGLNLVSGQPIYLYGSQYPGGRAINKGAFSVPATNVTGSAPRNFVRGFGSTQTSLAMRRECELHDNLKLQFRAETFNVLNHPSFGYVDSIYTDATFGEATKMLNSSLETMAAQYQQGGARSMQFAFKLLF